MNSYTTSHMRTRPQITQRHYETRLSDGSKLTAHGVRGANGEWDLSTYRDGTWNRLGIAHRDGAGWDMDMNAERTIKARTIAELIRLAFESETGASS